jgi:hypothetical protein
MHIKYQQKIILCIINVIKIKREDILVQKMKRLDYRNSRIQIVSSDT